MANRVKKIGIITSGGDCGGLNAIIKGAALAGTHHGIRSFVIPHGYAGLYNLIEYDDLVDSTTQALMRYRQGNFVQLPSDDWVDTEPSTYLRSDYG